jgi:4-hydroxy-tetrahydrodipicolinate reductase
MGRKIKVAICGLGFTGKHIARMMLQKECIECVGAVDKLHGIGRDLGDVLELGKKTGVVVAENSEDVLNNSSPDVWIEATATYIKDIYPRVINALNKGSNVITLAEEFTDPWLYEPEMANEIDKTAKRNNVTIVGTGFNPGLWMDIWPYFLTGYASVVKAITIHYMSDLSTYAYSPTIVRNFGFGLDPEEFNKKISDGDIKLSIGTKGLANNLANSLGDKIVSIHEGSRPLISRILLDYSPSVIINPGQVYGGSVDVHATTEKGVTINFYKQFCLKPSMEIPDFGDIPKTAAKIEIEGEPNISSTLSIRSAQGFSTTAPRIVNWIPYIVKANPGLLIDMREFPLIGAIR